MEKRKKSIRRKIPFDVGMAGLSNIEARQLI
jgi:hypothetical protein